MTAGEFAFLALGLLLGVASGAALVFVIRARPPAPREVRLTMTSDAVPRRVSATLASGAFETSPVEPARGGPADRRAVDRPAPDPGTEAGSSVAVPIHREPDPMIRALRVSTAVGASAPGATARGEAGPAPDRPRAMGTRQGGSGAAGSDATGIGGRGREGGDDPAGSEPRAGSTAGGTSTEPPAAGRRASGQRPSAPARTDDPCGEALARVDERCRQAEVAQLGATTAAQTLAAIQRDYDDRRARADQARSDADPRRVQERKEAARAGFRVERGSARDRAGLEAAARTWLTNIDAINASARSASRAAAAAEAEATALLPALERLSAAADAAHISAETAESACLEARMELAACREAAEAGRRLAPGEATAETDADVDAEEPVRTALAIGNKSIFRLLAGDRETRSRIAAALDERATEPSRTWVDLLGELADAIRTRAIEQVYLTAPSDQSFWRTFTTGEARDILGALAALGCRYDGDGGWADGRLPSQRDLSLAVGYAGQDPMRIRTWPTEREMTELLRDVEVAVDEYLIAAGGELSLGEVVDLLGPYADDLTDLWNEWGTVRPLLLAEDDASA